MNSLENEKAKTAKKLNLGFKICNQLIQQFTMKSQNYSYFFNFGEVSSSTSYI